MEKEINCVYGSGHTPDICFFVDGWYCVKGSVNVNKTAQIELFEASIIDVELVDDIDCSTAQKPINSLEELKEFLED